MRCGTKRKPRREEERPRNRGAGSRREEQRRKYGSNHAWQSKGEGLRLKISAIRSWANKRGQNESLQLRKLSRKAYAFKKFKWAQQRFHLRPPSTSRSQEKISSGPNKNPFSSRLKLKSFNLSFRLRPTPTFTSKLASLQLHFWPCFSFWLLPLTYFSLTLETSARTDSKYFTNSYNFPVSGNCGWTVWEQLENNLGDSHGWIQFANDNNGNEIFMIERLGKQACQ